jgi:peptidoglycan/LPS O-acetylase OafA/YrhL
MASLLKFIQARLLPEEEPDLQSRFYRGLCLLAGVTSIFVVIPINAFQTLPAIISIGAFIFGAFAFLLYWQARRGRYYQKSLFIALLLTLNVGWFPNAGSEGSIGYYFFAALMYPVMFFDGLSRRLAILLVLVWHYYVKAVQDAVPGSWLAYSLAALRLTWSGVDLFFVLSGFLIGGILYDAKDATNYYRTFYVRRIFRIFPLYFLWVALFFAGLALVGRDSAGPLRALFNRDLPGWSYPLFLQNIFMSSRGTFGPEWVAITWSLASSIRLSLSARLRKRRANSSRFGQDK